MLWHETGSSDIDTVRLEAAVRDAERKSEMWRLSLCQPETSLTSYSALLTHITPLKPEPSAKQEARTSKITSPWGKLSSV